MSDKPRIFKKRRGSYLIVGLKCGCGGELNIERYNSAGEPLSNDPDFRWETYCTKCGECDPNGWPTLKQALDEAVAFSSPASEG